MASYTALMNIQVDSQQAQLGINNLNKNLTYLSRSSRLTNKSLLQMQQTFLRIENTINQATGNTASFNAKMQQATNIIKKLRGEVSSLRSEVDNLNKKLKGTNGPLDKQRTLWERLSGALQKNQYFTSLAISALAGFVSQRLVGGIIRITDEYTLMENKIKTVTPTVDGVARSMESVYRIAQETRQPLAIVANLYSRIGRNSKELQQNLSALVDITSTVSKAFQLGGATIEESRNAMVQFSQALASGRLQGDELRSILELAPVLAENISKSIGITTGSLRRLASEGLITTEVLIKALLEAGKDIRAEFANFTPTVSQSFETVSNSFIKLIGSNQKFKDANETLGNQLRKFASALDEQGSLANKLGDAYLVVARNVDVLAAALAGLAVVIAGAGIAGLIALLASSPVVASITGLAAIATAVGAYSVSASSAEEETSKLVDSTKSLLKILSDTDMKTLSEKNVADIQADIMGKQAGIQTLISETSLALKEINEDLKETEQYNAVEKILGSDPKFARLLAPGASLLYKDEAALRQEKALKEERLEMLRDLAKQLGIEYENIAKAEQEGALKAMLARTKALEMQKRQLKEQEKIEQLSYYEKMGGGASDRSLQDIQFANQAAQKLRQELSKLQMASLNTAFVGMFSVEQLFGGTDPAAAVDNINDKMREFISITEKDEAGGIVKFFTDYLGTGGPEGEKAIKEITEKLTKEPFLAKNLRQAMISVWQAAAAEYAIYAAKRKAEEDRFVNTELRNMRNELQIMDWEYATGYNLMLYALNEGVDAYEYQRQKADNLFQIERARYIQELDIKDITEENKRILLEQFDAKREYIAATVQQQRLEEGINQVLSNREKLREGEQEPGIRSRVGGVSDFGGASLYNEIGSTLRDINIEYEKAVEKNKSLYHMNTQLLINLNGQEKLLRDQNIQREIALKLENLKLEAARQAQSNILLAEQIDLEESGLNSAEVRVRLIQKETELQFSALDAMVEAGNLESERADQLKRGLGNLMLQRVEAEKLNNIREALLATKNERAIGNAVIDGISALISGDFYKSIWNSISSGATNFVQSIQNINWETFGEDFANKIKNIDWKGIALDFGELFKSASGLLEAAATVGGQSGQRALNISKAGAQGFAAGGPIGGAVAALGAAIMSNEKFQQALSRLFDALFKLIDPFLDLLGPVIDIFTAFLENNPIMTAVNALKPLLEGLSNAIGALAAVIKNLDLSGDNFLTNIPVIGPAIKYMADGSMAKDIENAFDKTFLSGFGGRGGILEVRIPALEDIMGKFYTDFAASGVMAGKKDFRTIYNETTKAFEGATKTYTEEVPDTYINYQYLTGNIIKGFKWVTKQVALTWKTVERTVPLTSAEIKAKAEEAVRKTFEKILEGIDEETKSIISETEKLNQESQSPLAAGLETIKGVRAVMQELEYGLTFLSSEKAEEARKQMEAFSKAQEEYFEALVGSEIRSATEDLQESILSFQRMATDPLTQSALGLDSFTNQVTEFQNAIDAVSDPAKKAALQANLTAFKAAFEAVSAATAYQMVQDIELRGYDLTKEQELAIKYEKEIMDVRAREDLTAQDKVKIINRLIAAREREVEAMEREQELLNLQGAQNTLQEILSTFEKTIEGINDLITSLYDQVQDLLFGEFNLDPYLQKFELASETYGTLLEAAFDPDATEDDIKQLQEFVNTYLGTARDLYKSSSTFQQIFSNVLSDLSMLGVQAGFNMPQTAVSGATSEIQDFIDATEDLSEELSETLNDLIFDLNSLGLAFANQKLDIIQDELGIPLKITNDEIVVDLSGVSVPLELTDSNFTLDTTKLNLAASFTVEALGFKNYEETVTFTPTISGFEDYSETATFTATITGWDSYTGTATFTSNITGFTDYSKTASFSALLTGWTDYSASSTLDVTLKDWVDYSVGSSLIATFSGWQDYSKSSTLSASFSGWQNYSKSSTLSTSFSGWQNYSNSATFTGSYGSSQGWKSYSATATFDPSPFVSEFENARNMIQSTIDSFSLNFSLLETLSVGGAYVSEAKITSKENAYYAGPGSGTTYAEAQKTSYDDEPVPSIQDLAATLKTLSPEATGYDYGIYYVIKSTEYDANTYTYRDKTLPRLALFSEKSDAEAAYNYIAGISSDTLDFQNLTKLGFQQGGLVPGPMDIIPAMLSPGEYIMSRGAVDSLGIGTLNSLNAGDFSALRQTGDPEVRRLLRELIVAVQTSDTEVNVYTDTKGETKAAINEFRTELRERSRRQGEKYVNVRYV